MTTHDCRPERYHTTIGSHEPAFRIADGDTIVTTTVDARGGDHRGLPVTPGGNPQTGPFFIEGAEPGDALAITLDRLTPNRPTGFTATVIAEALLDPPFVRDLPAPATLLWSIDTARRTVSPTSADGSLEGMIDPPPALADLVLPLEPMIGCFGVAPAGGEAISTATSGAHGGNMDYRGFREGVTVFFPVAVPGALFHIGDGHATQGDGEIVGTGVETSFEVQFTCRLRKGGGPIAWPRGENRHHIFTAGNARPLDQALQHATTEMVRWLRQDYGLEARAASTLMGQVVRYDIGNVFDPAYTVVCKMPKALLPTPVR
ncbi:MAG: acetamidase/formamidase family protein [Candidatus Dormibacteraceae bacterium]